MEMAAGTVVVLLLLLLIVLSSVAQNVALPLNYEFAENETLDLSNVLVQNCVGTSCWFFGATLFGAATFYMSFYIFNRVFPMLGVFLILLIFAILVPYILVFDTLDTLFEWVKLFSVFGAVGFICLFRLDMTLRKHQEDGIGSFAPGANSLWDRLIRLLGKYFNPGDNLLDSNLWCWLMYGMLALNIGEACMADLSRGNIPNALAGFFLVLSMPRPAFGPLDFKINFYANLKESWQHILFIDDAPDAYHDMVYATPWFWVFLYTTWNAAFSYDERREHFAIILVVLLVAVLSNVPRSVIRIDSKLYVQSRTYTLLMRYVILGFFDVYQEFADASYWYNAAVKNAWGYANCGFILLFLIWRFYRVFIQTETTIESNVKEIAPTAEI